MLVGEQLVMSDYDELLELYAFHDELGAGGFGKVKLATHLLTNQKVAIKIIDKKQIGHDLPRVKTEMDALRNLSHQNICRLYHYIETKNKFFIVMEFCSGGEMFDYIVRKERLEESEARHFFRQLVSAIAYVHSQGFAHRDLKPENLLLTEELHLKLIDFGLCAKAAGRLDSHQMDTCCGSPAYAAPELIKGEIYKGNEADVWSMGVLLYALLCGTLPFEDDNMQLLYRKITKGNYVEFDWLTPSSKELLRNMLQVNPKHRITIQKLLQHPWMNHKYSQPIKWNTIYDKNVIDEDVAREMAYYHRTSLQQQINKIKEWKFDYMTATYFLLLQKKRRGDHYALPMPPRSFVTGVENTVLNSPTIHASLENNLDRSGLEEEESSTSEEDSSTNSNKTKNSSSTNTTDSEREVRFARPLSPDHKKMSYVNAMLNMPAQFTGRSPQRLIYGSPYEGSSAKNTPTRRKEEKENLPGAVPGGHHYRLGVNSCKVRGPVKIVDDGTRRSIFSTPNSRPPLRGIFSPGGDGKKARARSSERGSVPNISTGSPMSIGSGAGDGSGDGRTPRSSTKTPRLRQRVFTSLERKAERVIHMLTPRKIRNDSPQVLKSIKNMVNVSMTSATSPEKVRDELIKVFEQQNIKFELNGWKVSGKQKDGAGSWMTVELEVVILESYGKVGIRRKRLNGDAFLYKKVCEKILLMANI